MIIRYAAFWKDREISVGQIRSLTPTNTGVQMMLQDEKAPSVFMMRKKDQVVLLIILKKRTQIRINSLSLYEKKKKLILKIRT